MTAIQIAAIRKIEEALEAIEKSEDDKGCAGCTFYDCEKWEIPCSKCSRRCKDYWRSEEGEKARRK